MNKKRWAIFCLILLIFLKSVPIFAMSVDAKQYVYDEVGVLSASEKERLNKEATALSDEYDVDVRVVVVSSMGNETDARAFAEQLFTANDFGRGSEKSGILLMLSMAQRDYALIAHGSGNQVLTDYGREKMLGHVLSPLGDDAYADGFDAYLSVASEYLNAYFVEGKAVDSYGDTLMGKLVLRLVQFFLPMGVAALTLLGMVGQMKTAQKQQYAYQYIVRRPSAQGASDRSDALLLKAANDDFLYAQQSLIPLATLAASQSSSHGGGTTINVGGFSGSSGKF